MRTPLLLLSSLFAASLSTAAQRLEAPPVDPTAPVTIQAHYRLNAVTGELTLESGGPERGAAAGGCGNPVINSFINIDDTTRYVDGAIWSGPIEFVDWGTITTETDSDIVAQFTVGFGTLDLDVSAGGPGSRLHLAFYAGYEGFGSPGANPEPVSELILTGLPGRLNQGDPAAGFILTVDLAGGMEFVLPEGEFGFSMIYDRNVNLSSAGLLQAFSGEPLGDPNVPDSKGQVAVLDRWVPRVLGGAFQGSVADSSDNNTGLPVGSHYLLLRKANANAAPPAEAFVRNDAAGSNPLALLPGGTPVLSQPFSMIAGASGTGDIGVLLAGYLAPTELPTPYGQLLVDITDPAGEQLLAAGLGGPHFYTNGFAAVTTTLPADVNLCGFDLFVQGIQIGGTPRLTNALDLTFGLN